MKQSLAKLREDNYGTHVSNVREGICETHSFTYKSGQLNNTPSQRKRWQQSIITTFITLSLWYKNAELKTFIRQTIFKFLIHDSMEWRPIQIYDAKSQFGNLRHKFTDFFFAEQLLSRSS